MAVDQGFEVAPGRVCVGVGRQSQKELRVCRDRLKRCPHLPATRTRVAPLACPPTTAPTHQARGAPAPLMPPSRPTCPPGDVPTARLQVRRGIAAGACVTGRASEAGVVRGSWVCCTVAMALAAEAFPLQTGDSGRTWGCVRREAGPGPPRGGMCRTGSRVGRRMPALVDNAAHCARTGAVVGLVARYGWWFGGRAC